VLHSLPATLAGRVVDRLVAEHGLVPGTASALGRLWNGTTGKELIYAALVVPAASVDRHVVLALAPAGHLVLDATYRDGAHELRVSVVPSDLPDLVTRPSSREFTALSGVVDAYVDEWSRLAG
jgi:hypothetical protein